LGKKAVKELLPMQPGDVAATCADVQDLVNDLHYKPATKVTDGIQRFIAWYREYYNV
jgi:UDP-glucuronate 4-epimerase